MTVVLILHVIKEKNIKKLLYITLKRLPNGEKITVEIAVKYLNEYN